MSEMQEQAVQLIRGLSEDNLRFVIEIIQKLIPQKPKNAGQEEIGIQAFRRLDAARAEIRRYLPADFDPDRELEDARAERYGSVD